MLFFKSLTEGAEHFALYVNLFETKQGKQNKTYITK